MRVKNLILLTVGTIIISTFFLYQYKVSRTGNFSSIADGNEYQINYSLKKESHGEWMIDIEINLKRNADLVIQESLVSFAQPISEEIRSKGDDLINHYFEGHVLNGTKLFSERKIKEILKESYIDIKCKTPDNLVRKERINF